MKTYYLKRCLTDLQAEQTLKTKFLGENDYTLLIDHDADGYDSNGKLLFRFRKGAIPFDVVKTGYESFKKSITTTVSRGAASGGSFKRPRKDGGMSNTTSGYPV